MKFHNNEHTRATVPVPFPKYVLAGKNAAVWKHSVKNEPEI